MAVWSYHCTVIALIVICKIKYSAAQDNYMDQNLSHKKSISLEWTWLHGETVGNQHTTEAEILLGGETPPSAASKKHGYFYPGSRSAATFWQVSDGRVWMFGGKGFDDKPTDEPKLLNDLWEFDTRRQMWRILDDADPNNYREDSNHEGPIPSPRRHAASCGVQDVMFVVFGGEGENGRVLNSTWLFYSQKSEWLILSLASHLLHPEGRKDAAHWCTKDKLTIFGGVGANNRTLDDMWEFSLRALIWTRVTRGGPSSRAGSLTWASPGRGLFIHGGYTLTHSNEYGLTDTWFYSWDNGTWREVHRGAGLRSQCSNSSVTAGIAYLQYGLSPGQLGSSHICNSPGARRYSATWVDLEGKLWLFGGEVVGQTQTTAHSPPPADLALVTTTRHNSSTSSLSPSSSSPLSSSSSSLSSSSSSSSVRMVRLMSDLWRFEASDTESEGRWVWMGMSTAPNLGPFYGTNYAPGAENRPGARCQGVSWTRKGQMLLFGGFGLDARNKTVYLNDMWLMVHSELKYKFVVKRNWFKKIPPWTVFFIVFGTFGGIVFSFGMIFFLKKMMESPNHSPSEFKVKYSRVQQNAFYDYS